MTSICGLVRDPPGQPDQRGLRDPLYAARDPGGPPLRGTTATGEALADCGLGGRCQQRYEAGGHEASGLFWPGAGDDSLFSRQATGARGRVLAGKSECIPKMRRARAALRPGGRKAREPARSCWRIPACRMARRIAIAMIVVLAKPMRMVLMTRIVWQVMRTWSLRSWTCSRRPGYGVP